MKLERVDILGFKSFGERTELAFHEGVTAIVGPNGCGKSNISDAVGWALGEQSAKSLRGQRMEDLIFNGTDSRPPVGMAEVNLRLSHSNGDAPSERREVVVSRRLYRSGESEYLMDGSPCRLRDIHDLFMDTGVGTKAYAIIEQGKIGLILSSKPTDRRGIIEEAAGITKYRARRRSAELKLQAAQQNLLRVNDIIYEVERQMGSLKRQAGKARRYRRLSESIQRLEKIFGVKRSRELHQRLTRLRAGLRSIADEELRRSNSLVTVESYLERLRLEQAEADGELARARQKLHELELGIERRENQMTRDGQQISDLDQRRVQLETEAGELEARHGPSSERLEARIRDEAAMAEELSVLESRSTSTQEALSRAALSLAEAEREMEEGRQEVVHRISKIAALRNFLQGVLANSEKVASEILKLESETRELEGERNGLERETRIVEGELAEQRSRARSLAEVRARDEEQVELLQAERDRVESAIARLREELSLLSGRLASLEELVAARALYGAGARHLLTEGRRRELRVVGSVADSIEVEPRFERAAEHFLAEPLQQIVVEDERDVLAARSCLHEDGVGRCDMLVGSLASSRPADATRAALSALQARGISGVVGLLSESIHATNGHADLLRSLLPDAVVMESLDRALEAFRQEPAAFYVTLEGDIVGPPGVARVGPGGPSEGLLASRREIREMQERLSALKQELGAREDRREELDTELRAGRAGLAQVQADQHATEKLLVGLEHRGRQLEDELARLERKEQVLASERARSEAERAALAAKRVELEQGLAEEEESRERIEARVQELRAALYERRVDADRLQGLASEEASHLAALRERVQAVRIDVERLREGVRELEARMSAARREIAEIGERRGELEARLARTREELGELVRERDVERERLVLWERREAELRARAENTEAAIKLRRRELESVRASRSNEEVAFAREEADMQHLQESFSRAHGISVEEASALLGPRELARDDESLAAELSELKAKLDGIGPVNPMADQEYQELETRYEFLTGQRKDLLDSISSTELAIRRIDATSRQRFQEAFDEINRHFEVTFRQLFGGGRAGLRLIDEQDVLESGIDIIAQPPGKKLQNVLLLSGGEKALTAIALMFAMFRYKPSPFCLLDEVDAPLDDANVGRFVSMLNDLRRSTQFIIITHNRKTMEIADRMYGVTMEEPGISKIVSVNLVEGAAVEVGA